MSCEKWGHFVFSYERNSSDSYLMVKSGKDEKVQNYQIQMMIYNNIRYILPFDFRQKDDEFLFCYNITSKISLSQLLNRGNMKEDNLIKILSNISKALLECGNYLLSDKCFLINEDYIYIDPLTMDIFMVYIPVPVDIDINREFKELAHRLTMAYSGTNEVFGGAGYKRLSDYINSDTFNIKDFDKILKDMMNDTWGNHPEELGYKEGIEDFNNKANVIKEGNREGQEGWSIQLFRSHTGKNQCESDKPNYRVKPAIILLIAFANLLILFILYTCRKYINFSDKGDDLAITYGAIGVVIIAVDVLIYTKLSGGKRHEKIKTERDNDGTKNIIIPDSSQNLMEAEYRGDIYPGRGNPEDSDEGRIPSNDTLAAPDDPGTVLLAQSKREYPCLLSLNDPITGEIQITKPSFILGRIGEYVDHMFTNKAIGKVHAEITSRDGTYYLKDFNSKNGTFINDIRIDSNIEYEIKGNDRLAFANNEYIFVPPR